MSDPLACMLCALIGAGLIGAFFTYLAPDWSESTGERVFYGGMTAVLMMTLFLGIASALFGHPNGSWRDADHKEPIACDSPPRY